MSQSLATAFAFALPRLGKGGYHCHRLPCRLHGHSVAVLMSLQHEKYTSQLQMNFKGMATKRVEQPMEHSVYTESPQAKLEKGERKPITGICSGTS